MVATTGSSDLREAIEIQPESRLFSSEPLQTATQINTILIVEDSRIEARRLEGMLKEMHLNSTTHHRAGEAMHYCEKYCPGAILMDIGLPDASGLELTRSLRSIKRFDGVPIIAVTGRQSSEIDTEIFEAGCNGYIPKQSLSRDHLIWEITRQVAILRQQKR